MKNRPNRKLINRTEVTDYGHDVVLQIKSFAPEKWRFVDLETGDCWRPIVNSHGEFVTWDADSKLEHVVERNKNKL